MCPESVEMLSKHDWSAIHINTCLLLLIVAAVHLFLNWAVFRSYIKKMAAKGLQLKQETILAVLLTGLVTAGAYFDIPRSAPLRTPQRRKRFSCRSSRAFPASRSKPRKTPKDPIPTSGRRRPWRPCPASPFRRP